MMAAYPRGKRMASLLKRLTKANPAMGEPYKPLDVACLVRLCNDPMRQELVSDKERSILRKFGLVE